MSKSSSSAPVMRVHLVDAQDVEVSGRSRDLYVPRDGKVWWVLNPEQRWVQIREGDRARIPVISYEVAEGASPFLFALQQLALAAMTVPPAMFGDLQGRGAELRVFALMGPTGMLEPPKLGVAVAL